MAQSPTNQPRPSIKPGSTFANLEAVLAALCVTIRVETFGTHSAFASYAAWQANMLTGGVYSTDRRELCVPPGPGQRSALEWGVGAAVAHDLGRDSRDPVLCRALFEQLGLTILHALPADEGLPSGELDGDYSAEELLTLRRHVAAGHVEVVQVNPITEAIYDPEDRQQTMFMWCSLSRVVRIVLAAEVDDDARAWLRDQLGVELDQLSVTTHGASELHIEEARRARDKLRAWRAEHPRQDAAEKLLDEAVARVTETTSDSRRAA